MGMALGTKKPTSDINVTPLIDVVLVLLIIFMVLTPLAEKQKYTRVPEYTPDAQPVPPDAVPPDQTVITVLTDGTVMLNKHRMTLEEAMEKIGPAYDKASQLGPLVNAEHRQSVVNWIQKGVEEGAKLVLDGRGVTVKGFEKGFYLGATIVDIEFPDVTQMVADWFPVCAVQTAVAVRDRAEARDHRPARPRAVLLERDRDDEQHADA